MLYREQYITNNRILKLKMFKNIYLGNFKRFQRCSLELRKINIFVGPNNSGKSSLISALRLVVQTLDSYDDQVPLLLNGPLGDFGTFKDIVYQNHRGRPLEIGFTVEVPDLSELAGSSSATCAVSFEVVFKYNSKEREIHADNIIIKLNDEHLISLRYSKESRRHNVEKIGRTTIPSSLKSVLSREFRVRHFLPVPIASRLGAFEVREKDSPYKQFVHDFATGKDADVLRKLIRLNSRLGRVIESTDYLGPLRTPPARTYLFSGERRKRIGIGGENMTAILATSGSRRSRGRSNDSIPITTKLNTWLQKAEMAKSAVLSPISDRHFELRIRNFFTGENQNIADVGYGHSQVLPFLAGGYALSDQSVYMAEQPELHLHPRAQAGLADFLLDLHNRNTQTLIETHSEHLVLRLQQHVAKGDIDPESVRIFYIHNNPTTGSSSNECPEVCAIDMDTAGKFTTPWPQRVFPRETR
jgi:predicted ATPase